MAETERTSSWKIPGLKPTLNNTGFMVEELDEFATDFIRFASRTDDQVMDLGCAFGVTTIGALQAGGRVLACDMEALHLDAVRENTPEGLRENLECVLGRLPDVDFPSSSFGAILCSRVLHFLDGPNIDASVRKMYDWLKPGGHLYLVANTPYGVWRNFIPVFEAKRARGDRWPGVMIDLENYMPSEWAENRPAEIGSPPFMNLLDPELLNRTCEEAGFHVKQCGFIDCGNFQDPGKMGSRGNNTGVLAVKPA